MRKLLTVFLLLLTLSFAFSLSACDNDDSTVELKADYICLYQGSVSAKDANIQVAALWQNNTVDSNEGSANIILDNSKLNHYAAENISSVNGCANIELKNNSLLKFASTPNMRITKMRSHVAKASQKKLRPLCPSIAGAVQNVPSFVAGSSVMS